MHFHRPTRSHQTGLIPWLQSHGYTVPLKLFDSQSRKKSIYNQIWSLSFQEPFFYGCSSLHSMLPSRNQVSVDYKALIYEWLFTMKVYRLRLKATFYGLRCPTVCLVAFENTFFLRWYCFCGIHEDKHISFPHKFNFMILFDFRYRLKFSVSSVL